MVQYLGVGTTNVATGRGDLKGATERMIWYLKAHVLGSLPGSADPFRERGDSDHRERAVLDDYAINRIIIHGILDHNHNHPLVDYCPHPGLIADDVPPYPKDYWNWGLKHVSGALRTASPELVRQNLLPNETVSVTEQGLAFRGLFYQCATGQREGWFDRKVGRRVRKVVLVHDPRDVTQAWVRLGDGSTLERCRLIERHELLFAGRSLADVTAHFREKAFRDRCAQERRTDANIALHAKISVETKRAREEVEVEFARTGDAVAPENVRANRAAEIANLRLASGIGVVPQATTLPLLPEAAAQSIPEYAALLESIRKERQQ
jgi:hypothetical protein